MILVGPFDIEVDSTISLGDLLRMYFQATGAVGVVDPETWKELAVEVWADSSNAHLHPISRGSAVSGSTAPCDLLLERTEAIYLPPIPPSDYTLVSVVLPAGGDAAETVMTDANARRYHIGGDTITNEQLEDVVYNAVLRNPATPSGPVPIYYYTLPPYSMRIDAVPNTPIGDPLSNHGIAGAEWLPVLLHGIDRMNSALEVHNAAVKDLLDIKGGAAAMSAVLKKISSFLGVYPSIQDSPVSGMDTFKTKVDALRQSIEDQILGANAPLPQVKKVDNAWAGVEKILNEPAMVKAYAEFDKVRAQYPITNHALSMASACYLIEGIHSPMVADTVGMNTAKAVETLTPSPGIVWKHLATTLSLVANVPATAVALVAGNTPGPPTMTVAAGKVYTFFKLAMQAPYEETADVSAKLLLWLTAPLSFPGKSIPDLVAMMKNNDERMAALTKKMETWDIWRNAQSGKIWLTGSLDFLNLVFLVNAMSTFSKDKAEGARLYTLGQDAVGAGQAMVGLVGTTAKLLVDTKLAARWQPLANGCETVVKGIGKYVGVGALLMAAMDCAEAMSKGGDPTKLIDALGNALIGIEPFLPMFASRLGPVLVDSVTPAIVRMVLGAGARTAAAEGAAFAGEAVAGGAIVAIEAAGAILAWVGALILIGILVYRNWQDIKDMTVARPGQACRTWLLRVEEAKIYAVVAPQSTKDAMKACVDAWRAAHFTSLNGTIDKVRAGLLRAGLDDSDIHAIADMPDQFMGMAMGG